VVNTRSRNSHDSAHWVKDPLLASQLRINDVTVHLEPCHLLDPGVAARKSDAMATAFREASQAALRANNPKVDS